MSTTPHHPDNTGPRVWSSQPFLGYRLWPKAPGKDDRWAARRCRWSISVTATRMWCERRFISFFLHKISFYFIGVNTQIQWGFFLLYWCCRKSSFKCLTERALIYVVVDLGHNFDGSTSPQAGRPNEFVISMFWALKLVPGIVHVGGAQKCINVAGHFQLANFTLRDSKKTKQNPKLLCEN